MQFSKISSSVFALAACVAVSGTVLSAATVRPALAAEEAEKDAVVAVVDGEELHLSDVQMMIGELPPAIRMLPMDRLYGELVRRLVDRRLMARKATEQKLDKEERVTRYIAFLREGALQEAIVRDVVEKKVTEDALRKTWEKVVAEMPEQEEAHARHILVEKEDEAKDLIARLEKGADFNALAKEHSTGPSGENGGDLGYFTAEQMVPEFSKAVFAMKAGEFTKTPVKTQFGFHIIKLEDKRKAEKPSFEEMMVELQSDAASQAISDMARELRDKAKITLFDRDGKEMPFYPPEEKEEKK